MRRTVVILSFISPICYSIFFILFKMGLLSIKMQTFIFENEIFFWIFQLLTLIVGFIVCKKRADRILFVSIFIFLFLFGLLTGDMFNPYTA